MIVVVVFIGASEGVDSRNDHTIMRTPIPVCSSKLSMIWSRQYYGGGPRWNSRCCSFSISFCFFPQAIYEVNSLYIIQQILLDSSHTDRYGSICFSYIFLRMFRMTHIFPLSKGAKTEPSSKEVRQTSKQSLETETMKEEVKMNEFTLGQVRNERRSFSLSTNFYLYYLVD